MTKKNRGGSRKKSCKENNICPDITKNKVTKAIKKKKKTNIAVVFAENNNHLTN